MTFWPKRRANLEEIHTYVQDLRDITILRNKCISKEDMAEAANYSTIIEVMQLVLLELNGQGQ